MPLKPCMTQERTELEKERRVRAAAAAERERLAAKMAKTAIMDLDGDGVIDANDVLSIYSTTYSESHNVKNSLLPVIRKVLPAPTPSPQEYYYTRNRLQTPAGVSVGKQWAPIFPTRQRPATTMTSAARLNFKLYGGDMGSSVVHHGGKYADQKDTSTWHDTTSSIRFHGGTLPGVEVPIHARVNSNLRDPGF